MSIPTCVQFVFALPCHSGHSLDFGLASHVPMPYVLDIFKLYERGCNFLTFVCCHAINLSETFVRLDMRGKYIGHLTSYVWAQLT